MAWAGFCDGAHRLKIAGLGGVIGVETDMAQRRMVAAGVDAEIAEDLLTACERGLMAAANERDETDG